MDFRNIQVESAGDTGSVRERKIAKVTRHFDLNN